MFIWTDDLLTGNKVIDEQHKEIFAKLDDVLQMSIEHSQLTEIIKIFEFLMEHVYHHFNCEEELMVEHSYPGYELHKQDHLRFVEKIDQLAVDLKQYGATEDFVTQLKVVFIELLVEHIDEIDKQFAQYLKTV